MSTIGTTDCVMLYQLVNAYYEVKLKKTPIYYSVSLLDKYDIQQ
jgi:hypothetical protein